MRPRLLDLFCCAGGAAMGYHRAGFDVVGVDLRPQPRYPFEFHQADALTFPLDGFDAIHASPPCQAYTRAAHLAEARGAKRSTVDLLLPMLTRLRATDVPWVVENVEGAPFDCFTALMCGSAFGLTVRRHRLFGSNLLLPSLGCQHLQQGRPVGIYHRIGDDIPRGGRTARTLEEGQAAMGIDWMVWDELKESIPPVYTEHIGGFLLDHLRAAV